MMETLLGLVHSGHRTSLSPGVKVLAWSTNNLCRILDGDTMGVMDGFRSLLTELVGEMEPFLMLTTSLNILLGDILLFVN